MQMTWLGGGDEVYSGPCPFVLPGGEDSAAAGIRTPDNPVFSRALSR